MTEKTFYRACGFVALALALVCLAVLSPVDASLPKISAKTLWPKPPRGRSTTTKQPTIKGREEIGRIIYDPTPAFLAQQKRQADIKARSNRKATK